MARRMRNWLWSDIVSPLPEGEGIKGVRTRGHGVRTARVTAAAAAALALAGCLLAAAGAGAGGAIYVTDRGAEAVIPAGLDRAATATRQAFDQLKIHETKSASEAGEGGEQRHIEGTGRDRDVSVTLKPEGTGSTRIQVVAKASAVTWDKDFARQILDKIAVYSR